MILKDAIAAYHSQKPVLYKGQMTKIKAVAMPNCNRPDPAVFIELVSDPVPLRCLDAVDESLVIEASFG